MIDSIQLSNFKSIKQVNLKLQAINILIGANGVGKSNFISFFKLLRSLYNKSLNTYVAEQGYMDNLLYFGDKTAPTLEGGIVFADQAHVPTNKYIFELSSDAQNRAFIQREVSSFSKATTKEPIWDDKLASPNSDISFHLHESDSSRNQELKNYFKSFYVYHFHDTSADSPLKKTAKVNDNSFLRENGGNLPAFLYWLQQRHPLALQKIEKVVHSIAPFFESFSLEPDRLNPEYIQLEWKEVGYDRYQNAHNLSDGTLRFIALTTLMLQPNPPKVIIIDEPELGLHPSAINKLAGLIQRVSIKSQVILSTQSVNLVDNFEPGDIITVDRENDQTVFKRLDPIELQAWLTDYGLGDLWFKSVIGGQP
jgi:predicted ATPase